MATPAHMPQFSLKLPHTRLGWIAVSLAAAFVLIFGFSVAVLYPLAMALPDTGWSARIGPFFSIGSIFCGLASGVTGLLALIFRRERSLLVWLTLLPLVVMVIFLLGEVLGPH
jgi:hypothetical protein